MSTIYERFGIRRIINAKGPSTRVSGGIMADEVRHAMAEAATACVDMAELQAAASRVIQNATGAEAGLVTAGAAAGLLLGTAACLTGLDPARMNRLPDARGMPNRVVMVRSQRNQYDHAIRTTGARIVEVGLPDRFAGAGVRDAEPFEIASAIDGRTAMVHWVAGPSARPPLREVVEVAERAGIPVLVDAAAELPPAINLRSFLDQGADLVVFSGGKALGGPQASGILAGRHDLIMAAALQQLDLDIAFAEWRPPADFIDTSRLPGLPQHGIGRPCKVGKEEVIGLLVALERFIRADPAARRSLWRGRLAEIDAGLQRRPGLAVVLRDRGEVPLLALQIDPRRLGRSARDLLLALEAGEPSIRPEPAEIEHGRLLINPVALADGDPASIVDCLNRVLAHP